MTSEPQFLDKFVAFVDILGFKSKVEASDRPDGTRLSEILKMCGKLENQSHIQSIAGYGPIICPESRYTSRDLDYKVTQISDCAIISSEVSPAGLINLLTHIAQSILGLLSYGVMVRGYVTRGHIFHNHTQCIGVGFQRAWTEEKSVRAFRMSEEDGGTPFVEIDPEVERYIREETDACVVKMFDRMTRKDSDNDVTVLFPFQNLTSVAGGNIAEPEKCRKDLSTIREWIRDYREKINLESPSLNPEASRKSKYYTKIIEDLLSECDEIEKFLNLGNRPAVKLMYDKDLNVIPIDESRF